MLAHMNDILSSLLALQSIVQSDKLIAWQLGRFGRAEGPAKPPLVRA